MTEITQKWIDAGKILANYPEEKVLCPQCGQNYLNVQDVRNENNPLELERIMCCTSCGAKNILRLKR